MRTMIDLEDSQASNLDAWAKVEKISRAEAVRRVVNLMLERVTPPQGTGWAQKRDQCGGADVPPQVCNSQALSQNTADQYIAQDHLSFWYLSNPSQPRLVGELSLASGGRAESLRYSPDWLRTGFALSEELPLIEDLFVPREKIARRAPLTMRGLTAGASGSFANSRPRPGCPFLNFCCSRATTAMARWGSASAPMCTRHGAADRCPVLTACRRWPSRAKSPGERGGA